MILADVASNATTINAAQIALVTALITVTVTVVAGFFGAWIQSRREHAKWVREKRYNAYERVVQHVTEFEYFSQRVRDLDADLKKASTYEVNELLSAEYEAAVKRQRDLLDQLPTANTPIRLVGPTSVEKVLAPYGQYAGRGYSADASNARKAMIEAMRKVLGFEDD